MPLPLGLSRSSAQAFLVAASDYVGPGDIISGATAFWGLRAYSRATAGNRVIQLQRSSDNALRDFNTLSNGALDTVAIAAWQAGTLSINKVYNQTGTGPDLPFDPANGRPGFALNTFGSFPTMAFGGVGTPSALLSTTTLTVVRPFTISTVSRRTINGAYSCVFGGYAEAAPADVECDYSPAADTFSMWGDSITPIITTATETDFHAIQWAFNTAGNSSDLNMDGTSNTAVIGATDFSFQVGVGKLVPHNSEQLDGDIFEVGMWPLMFATSTSVQMSANQHAYWGF